MKNIRIWELALGIGVLCALLLGAWARDAQASLSEKIVRLHVVANSDTENDQALKQQVRDAVLAAARPLLSDADSTGNAGGADGAARALEAHLPYLRGAAEAELRRLGCEDGVTASVGVERFPTREYDGFALPAGHYKTLRVTIGAGAGQNWWCVVFPPLCDAAASPPSERAAAEAAVNAGLSDADAALIADQDGVKFKFRCVEWWAEFKRWLGG